NRRIGLSNGVLFELEMRLLKDGEYRWNLVQYNPLRDESGRAIRWYVTAIDIEDRKRAEEKLQQSEADLRTITDAIRQAIVVLAPDGTALYANRVALERTGLESYELSHQEFFGRAFHSEDVDRVRKERQTRLLEGVPFELEMRARQKNGEYRW